MSSGSSLTKSLMSLFEGKDLYSEKFHTGTSNLIGFIILDNANSPFPPNFPILSFL